MTNGFQVIHDSAHGQALYSEEPKLDAYKHMAFMQRVGFGTSLTVNEDGSYTVTSTHNKTGKSQVLTFEAWPELTLEY